MPHLALGRLCPVLDLSEQLWLDPDALVRDAPSVRLRFPDQRRQALAQLGGRGLVEAMVDLASVEQVAAFARPR